MGWEDLKNGKLLAEAGRAFEVMITTDQNLKSQQNLKYLPVAVIVLLGRSNKIEDLQPLAPLCELVMKTVKRGQLFEVRLPDQIVEVTA